VSLCLGKTLTEPLLPLVLAGQPEFAALLKRSSLRQISQRVALHCRLDRLSDEDVAPYILHRLRAVGHEQQDIFTPEALRQIVTYAAGIPRKINLLCDNALLLAYSEKQKTVSAEMVDEVAEDFLLPASSPADLGSLVSAMDTQSDNPPTVSSTLIHRWKGVLKNLVQTTWLGLNRRFREYRPPQLGWVEGGLALALLFLLFFRSTAHDVIRLTTSDLAPEQVQEVPSPTSPGASRLSFPIPVAAQQQFTQELPTSYPSQPEAPVTQPPDTIPSQSEQKESEDKRQPIPGTRAKPHQPSQKPGAGQLHIPTLLARAERQVVALRQAADGLTVEIDRIASTNNGEVTDRPSQGTKEARRAAILLERAQQHEDALRQVILQLARNTSNQTSMTSTRLTALLKQTKQHETLLRQTATQLQATALRRVKAQLQEEKKYRRKGEPPLHEEIVQAANIAEDRQEEFDPPLEEESGTSFQTLWSPEPYPLSPHNNTNGWTPLMLAALRGDEDAVRRLLIYGAEVNATNNAGGNAFMTAALQGHQQIVRLLLDKGASINAKNNKGWTALMYAAWNGHSDIVKMLLAKGADVNVQNAEGWTALMYATWKGQSETVRVLLAGRATVTTLNHYGESALTVAAARGNSEIALLLGQPRTEKAVPR
jgi:hypothetical protein